MAPKSVIRRLHVTKLYCVNQLLSANRKLSLVPFWTSRIWDIWFIQKIVSECTLLSVARRTMCSVHVTSEDPFGEQWGHSLFQLKLKAFLQTVSKANVKLPASDHWVYLWAAYTHLTFCANCSSNQQCSFSINLREWTVTVTHCKDIQKYFKTRT